MFSYFDLRFPSCACFPGFPRPVQTLKECGRGFVRDAIATNAINVRSPSPTASKMTKKGQSNGENILLDWAVAPLYAILYRILSLSTAVLFQPFVSAFCFRFRVKSAVAWFASAVICSRFLVFAVVLCRERKNPFRANTRSFTQLRPAYATNYSVPSRRRLSIERATSTKMLFSVARVFDS